MKFTGTYTALVTPFRRGRVDEAAFQNLVGEQIRGGVDGIVPTGTTGESPTLEFSEHIRVIELAVQTAKGKIKVIAGTGANSTAEAIELTQAAEAVGADGSLLVSPYYNKPSQEGLFQHFKKIAKATKLPIVLYSIPGRCNIAIEVATVKRLAKVCENIVGIKEAGGDADRVSQLRQALGQAFSILSGDDALTLPFMSVGAEGVFSVASNIIPRQLSRMVNAHASGKNRRIETAPAVLSDVSGSFHRDQPGAGQGRPRDAGQVRRGIPFATLQNVTGKPEALGQDAEVLRCHLISEHDQSHHQRIERANGAGAAELRRGQS